MTARALLQPAPAFFLALALILPGWAQARCLAQDPASVNLSGVIEKRTLPGPPNYISVGRGDRPETVYFIDLDEPICVSGNPASRRNSKSHAGVEEIQLTGEPGRAKTAVGKHVRITGKLSTAQTANDRTPVVVSVRELRVD